MADVANPTHSVLQVPADETFEYRSVPGRATSPNRRRIDLSASDPFGVAFYRLRPLSGGGVDRYDLGLYIVGEAIPLIWPVPEEASMEDILVVVSSLTGKPIRVQLMDFWRTN